MPNEKQVEAGGYPGSGTVQETPKPNYTWFIIVAAVVAVIVTITFLVECSKL